MELMLTNGFTEMSIEEKQNVSGGFIIAIIACGATTITITSGHVIAAVGTAYAAGKVVGELKKTFL